jgi:hypothetical protein
MSDLFVSALEEASSNNDMSSSSSSLAEEAKTVFRDGVGGEAGDWQNWEAGDPLGINDPSCVCQPASELPMSARGRSYTGLHIRSRIRRNLPPPPPYSPAVTGLHVRARIRRSLAGLRIRRHVQSERDYTQSETSAAYEVVLTPEEIFSMTRESRLARRLARRSAVALLLTRHEKINQKNRRGANKNAPTSWHNHTYTSIRRKQQWRWRRRDMLRKIADQRIM